MPIGSSKLTTYSFPYVWELQILELDGNVSYAEYSGHEEYQNVYRNISEWCEQTFAANQYRLLPPREVGCIMIKFRSKDDAALFKMKWL